MSENHYQILFETAQNALFLTSPTGHMIDINPAWITLFSYTKEEAMGLSLSAMFVQSDAWQEFWHEIEQQGSIKDFAAKLYTKDARQIGCTITLITRRADDGSIIGYRGIIENVRLFEQDLRQAYQQLKELDRLKSSFIGVITHELRSPFVAADLSVQLLYRYVERGMVDEMLDQLKRLDQELAEGRRMIDSIISFAALVSKQGGLFLEETDLAPLIRDSIAPLEKMAATRQIKLRFRFAPDLPQAYLDQQRIGEAIYHLVHNAIKFNREGGTVEISCWSKDGKILFRIKDTGRGIPAEDLTTIWQAFAQMADEVQRGLEGLGLGLALVKSAVDAHGGEVSVTSAPNKGSTFGFWVPLKLQPKRPGELVRHPPA
jgi:PAS domain S-box-containing protein